MIEARRRRTAALAVTALVIGLIIGAPGATAAVSAVASVAFAPGLDRSAMPFASAASAAPARRYAVSARSIAAVCALRWKVARSSSRLSSASCLKVPL